jgi:biopolymer transport protein ExbD
MPIKLQNSDEIPQPNLTSMIDVLFLLILFFVVATKFMDSERQIELKVPQVSDRGALTAAPEKKVINVYQDGAITLDGADVTLEQLTKHLSAARSQYKGIGVLVRGDGTGQFQRVASVLSACRQAGIAELGIAVRSAEGAAKNVRR